MFFNTVGGIIIGENCNISYQVIFCTSTHEVENSNRRAGRDICKQIVIKDRCWIGARTLIMPGVTINQVCDIAAGYVVTKDCEPNCIYTGVPAVKVRVLDS